MGTFGPAGTCCGSERYRTLSVLTVTWLRRRRPRLLPQPDLALSGPMPTPKPLVEIPARKGPIPPPRPSFILGNLPRSCIPPHAVSPTGIHASGCWYLASDNQLAIAALLRRHAAQHRSGVTAPHTQEPRPIELPPQPIRTVSVNRDRGNGPKVPRWQGWVTCRPSHRLDAATLCPLRTHQSMACHRP